MQANHYLAGLGFYSCLFLDPGRMRVLVLVGCIDYLGSKQKPPDIGMLRDLKNVEAWRSMQYPLFIYRAAAGHRADWPKSRLCAWAITGFPQFYSEKLLVTQECPIFRFPVGFRTHLRMRLTKRAAESADSKRIAAPPAWLR